MSLTKDQVIDYDGTCDYDGDQWTAAEYYIKALEKELANQYKNSKFVSDKELFTWLSTRKKTEYCDGPVLKIDN